MLINTATTVLTATIRESQKNAPPSTEFSVERPRDGFGGGVEKLAEAVMDTTFFAFNEIAEAGKNDPALALRYGATTISEKLLEGVGQPVRDGFGVAIIPTIRVAILGANVFRAKTTFKDQTSHWAEKSLDVARVATDVLGVVGSVLKYAMPSKAALGDTLVGISYAADTVSHSARLLTHGADRVSVWKKQLAERKAEKKAKQGNAEVPAPQPIATNPLANVNPILLK